MSLLLSSPSPLHVVAAPLPEPAGRPLAEVVAPGRLVELSGQARTSSAASILAHVQREGDTAAWIQLRGGQLYPPDLAERGIDLDALIVVHVPAHEGPHGQCRAAELLLRSGGFGLLVIDFVQAEPKGSPAWMGRLLALARQHETRVLLLREASAEEPSLGPLVSLRIDSRIERIGTASPNRTGRFSLVHEVVKNKSGGPVEASATTCRGPWGMG